jgi:hypothetical protein
MFYHDITPRSEKKGYFYICIIPCTFRKQAGVRARKYVHLYGVVRANKGAIGPDHIYNLPFSDAALSTCFTRSQAPRANGFALFA